MVPFEKIEIKQVPLAAILNFAKKCKQTAVSQKLSKIKNYFQDIFCIS